MDFNTLKELYAQNLQLQTIFEKQTKNLQEYLKEIDTKKQEFEDILQKISTIKESLETKEKQTENYIKTMRNEISVTNDNIYKYTNSITSQIDIIKATVNKIDSNYINKSKLYYFLPLFLGFVTGIFTSLLSIIPKVISLIQNSCF